MPFTFQGRSLSKVGVIGSGQIGPDIALYFAKVFAEAGVQVVVVDVSEKALEAGKARTEKKIKKGQETGAFKGDLAEKMIASLTWTTDYAALSGAEFVVEAATENDGLKRKIFAQLESTCAPGAILASNSSHLEPEVIFAESKDKSRTACIHYFFPADRNIVVEITPGKDTSPKVTRWLLDMYETIGKLPIEVKSRYGYAIDPVFEGLFLAALSMRDKGLGTIKEIDAVAMKALGLGVGPFTAMNLTGGNPITAVGLDHYTTKINSWFKTPPSLKQAVEAKTPWETAGRDEKVEVDADKAKRLGDLIKGAYFGLVSEILDAKLSTLADLDLAVSTALVVKPPFTYMNETGVKESLALVEGFAKEFPGFVVPKCLKEQAASGKPWPVSFLQETTIDSVRVIKIRRPDKLNALNEQVFANLDDAITRAGADASVKGVVITGFGTKAFVAGADIGMLSQLKNAKEGYENSRLFHRVCDKIEALKKPVVCAYNGLAFGGGNELAMACHYRIAKKGLKPLAGQPEPNLGIIPGAGGTQRLPRIVGLEKAWPMLRTGKPITGAEGLAMGLISEEVEGSMLLTRAVAIANGSAGVTIKPIPSGPMGKAGAPPELDIEHLSKKIDQILCKAVLDGWSMTLAEGLDLESRCFGECVETKDMHVGMETFLTQGAKAKAAFVHE